MSQIVDFKSRVLDFISIYVKEAKENPNGSSAINNQKIIKNLLRALKTAHLDKNEVLARRIETVLSNLTKLNGGSKNKEGKADKEDKDVNKGRKLLMTEVMNYVLKPGKSKAIGAEGMSKMQKAYLDSFLSLTRQFMASDDADLHEFVLYTYKELMKTFLSGNGRQVLAPAAQQTLFQRAFE